MRLHYEEHEPHTELRPLPHVETPRSEAQTESIASSDTAPRYDTAAVKEILARAEQMQANHRATLTQDAIVALGQEVGVEPEFVQRALSQMEAKTIPSPTLVATTRRTRRERELLAAQSLTLHQWATAVVPAVLYLLFCLLLVPFNVRELDVSSNAAIAFYAFLPAVLAICVGGAGKSKRVGAMGGGLLGLAVLVCLLSVTAFHHRPMPTLDEFFPVFAVLVGSGIALGTISAGLCQVLTNPRSKRIRVRLVMETDEAEETEPTGEWV